ncbi:MAG TPA: glycoside hydrolase family 3 protein [Pseudoalteromonas prydzensis]|uniref:Glycoside hydrolase family 3 protein n=1 Tax=Pseudoalteromonas prydzensis TaxID=182141 RepID=A0A7V1D044_9GAMM|nr:glycoside hydrolase family 3 N-terminal domain-containing protein [Pseudoalteromonas prydzensis]HEA17491.1 glycoside hydrolase family 3 protein [Pseudoalteromonas prydzensis]
MQFFNTSLSCKFIVSSVVALSMVACSAQEQTNLAKNATAQAVNNITLWPEVKSPLRTDPQDNKFVADLIARMSVEEKVGQLIQAEIQAITPEQAKAYHIGSILNGGGSVPNRKDNASATDWATFADSFYLASIDKSGGRTGVPIIWGTDAVHGHGNLVGATLFPHNIGLGATRNTALIKAIGEATAKEVRASGIEWVFAPTLAVARNDRWGRTYESYSENPELVAEFTHAMVIGLQGEPNSPDFLDENHVAATAKHFLADGGTEAGDDQGDAKMTESELVTIHNAGYPKAITAGVQSIMASFSSFNGEKMHGNKYLLTDVLKSRMGFDGFVVGDWNGHGQVPDCSNDSCAKSVNAGIDLLMAPYDWLTLFENTLAQVKTGQISQARLDAAVADILLVKKRLGLFNGVKPTDRKLGANNALIGAKAHRELARQAVRESLVLLKNNQQILPLQPKQTILVTGSHADDIAKQAGGWSVTWQGTGLKNSQFPGATSIYKGIKQQAVKNGSQVILSADGHFEKKPDVAIVVFGETPYAEGQGDVNTLEFEAGNKKSLALLKKLKAQGIPVVSVFISGRPLWVNPEINASDAFVAAWLPGSEGLGVAELLMTNAQGKSNYDFSGKLAFSWPKLPTQDELNIGDENYDPLFAYGYGLTYQDHKKLAKLAEDVPGVASGKPQDINLYVGRPLQPWHVVIKSPDSEQLLSGAFAELTDGKVKVTTSDKDVQEDALTFSYQDTWFSSLYLSHGKALNLAPFVKQGAVTFDIRIDDIKKSALDLVIDCGASCRSKLSLKTWALAQQGKGWQHLSIPLRCFEQAGADFSQVNSPFSLEAGGKGQLAVANIQFKLHEEGNFSCPDIARAAVTPAKLNAYWAEDWWLPRHEEKVAAAKKGDIELLMLGDSITHNWENEQGKPVWQQHFADIKTLNLGFGGDRTENVLWRLKHGEVEGIAPKLAVVMIGTNNTGHRMENPTYIANGVNAIITELKQRLANTKILLLAIFPRGADANDELRLNNQRANVELEKVAKQQGILFSNINNHFLTATGELSRDIMPDYLHPNGQGYEIWAEQLTPYIKQYIK